MQDIELFNDIPGYEGSYQASTLGNIRSVDRHRKGTNGYLHLMPGKVLRQSRHKHGYRLVWLSKDGKRKACTVHRLVAMAFLPNPNNLPQINHKDGNKANNRLSNLEWCDASYNTIHSRETLGNAKTSDVAIKCIETNQTYKSIADAARVTGINKSAIGHAVNGITNKAGGLTWQRI